MVDSSEEDNSSLTGPQELIEELKKTGIRLKNKNYLKISNLEVATGTRWIHALGNIMEEPSQRVAVSFGP